MAVLGRALALLAVAAIAGCYAPELPDCAVSCAQTQDCATGQVCGNDGFCAAPALAGQCAGLAPDAGVADAPPDAPLPDAPPPDAPEPWVELRIEIKGDHGRSGDVVIDGVGRCDGEGQGSTVCVYAIHPGPVELTAIADDEARFDKWESEACHDQAATCTAIAVPPQLAVTAKFRKHDD